VNLAQTQKQLYALITGFGEGPRAAAPRIVKGTRALSPLTRVKIYGDQYFWRMYEALTLDFPKTCSQLPEATLRKVVKQYATQVPSRHWDLGRFGSGFVAWLAKHPVKGARRDLIDLAALEWARSEAFLAADATPIDAAAMARVPADKLPGAVLSFVPSCRLVWCTHEVAALFEALRADSGLKTPDSRKAPKPNAQPQQLVVWRKGFLAWHSVIALDEAKALKAALAGKPLAAVVAHFGRREDPASAAFTAVGSWVTEGMISGV
jgi:hypothetical protein